MLRKGCPNLSRNSITRCQKMGPVLKDKQDWGRAVGGIQMGNSMTKGREVGERDNRLCLEHHKSALFEAQIEGKEEWQKVTSER